MSTVTDPEGNIELTVAECRKLARFVRAIARAVLYRILAEGKIRSSSLRSRGALRGIRLIDRASLDAYVESFATGSADQTMGDASI